MNEQKKERIARAIDFWLDELEAQIGDNDEALDVLDRLKDCLTEQDLYVDELESIIDQVKEVLPHDKDTAA